MKSRDSQKGNAVTIVIIIILVVVVLGLLGYVFWQHFGNKTDTKTASTTSTISTKESSDTLAIKEWGISGPTSGINGLEYVFGSHGGNTSATPYVTLNLTTPTLEASSDCSANTSGEAAISRFAATDTVYAGTGSTGMSAADFYTNGGVGAQGNNYSAEAHIGNYYYFLNSPQGECDTEGSSIQTQADATYSAAKAFLAGATQN